MEMLKSYKKKSAATVFQDFPEIVSLTLFYNFFVEITTVTSSYTEVKT